MHAWNSALFLISTSLAAQHCAFDFNSIIVVHPHSIGDTALIDGLRIVLLDKDNLPATATGEPFHLFSRNNQRSELIHPRTFRKQHRRVFPFAGNNYILVVPDHFHMDDHKILVLDERPGKDGPRYRYQVMHLHPSQCHPLCGRYDQEVYAPMEGRPNFAPIDITLFPR